VMLGAGLADAFLGLHIAISLAALYAAWRIRGILRERERMRAAAAAAADAGAGEESEPPTSPIGLVGAGA